MDRAVLEKDIARGLTLKEIAVRHGVDRSTVRRWLRRYGLRTQRMRSLDRAVVARATGSRELDGECPAHGAVVLRRDARGSYRCPRCNQDRVTRRRRRIKALLVAEAGGRCALCGYCRCVAALEFHHLDPATKAFGVGLHGVTRSLERARAEARKCVLLCSNCHAEVEAGFTKLALT